MHAKRTNIFTREFWKRATWILYHAQLACNDPDEIFWIQPNKKSFHIRICWVEIDCIGRTTTQMQAFTFNHFSPFQPYCIVWLLITAKLLLLQSSIFHTGCTNNILGSDELNVWIYISVNPQIQTICCRDKAAINNHFYRHCMSLTQLFINTTDIFLMRIKRCLFKSLNKKDSIIKKSTQNLNLQTMQILWRVISCIP